MAEADVLPVGREHLDRGQAELAGGDDVLVRVGDRLRAARERMGIGRAELSLRTKINERHLEALEDSDFTALPARIYAVGFARTYACAVGLDAGRIAAEVRRELSERENPPLRPPNQLHVDDPTKVPSNRVVWLSLALVALLIVAGLVFWRSYYVPAVDLPPVREEVLAPELSPQAQISPTAESAVPVQAAAAPAAQAAAPAPRSIAPVLPTTQAPASQVLPAPVVPQAAETATATTPAPEAG